MSLIPIWNSSKFLILFITSIIFGLGLYFGIDVLLKVLSFLILLELVRTIYEFIVKEDHRIKIRYVIDGAIVFVVHELFVGLLLLKKDLLTGGGIVGITILCLSALISYRKEVILTSPDKLEKEFNEED